VRGSKPISTVPVGRLALSCWLAVLLSWPGPGAAEGTPATPIPPENAADLTQAPARPKPENLQSKARSLFDAVVHDDPSRAKAFFFPRDAFLLVKDMPNPGRYYDRLYKRFERDIHALHQKLPELREATFDHLELVRRGGWVAVHEEGNRLPYWASRHSWLHYRVGEAHRKLEVRVLITWGNDWYVIHLSEFK